MEPPSKQSRAMKMNVNKDSVVPRYLQVKRYLKAQILGNRLKGKIPSERNLAEQCEVSYLTVRRSVGELVEEGLLYRERGRGTFVSELGKISKRTYNVALVVPPMYGMGSQYFAWVFSGLEGECHKHRYALFFATDASELLPMGPRAERQLARKVDGIIVFHMHTEGEDAQIIRMSRFVPVVVLNEVVEGANIPSVVVDSFGGAHQAVKYLLDLGHRRIGHVTGPLDSMPGTERLEGYKSALTDAGVPVDEELISEGAFTFQTGYDGTQRLLSLSAPATAIFCANDGMMIGAMRWIYENGLSIPGDVSLVGFDNIATAARTYPPLTTVDGMMQEIGRTAFGVLQEMIETGETSFKDRKKVVPTKLIVRDSCAPPAASAGE